ncbi:hypothetical protein FQN54_003067 [Arachnomyces sp. PD_36]|nr:hypothetical protein FQN54_003067 [Arachnomyces sp. PD_36]
MECKANRLVRRSKLLQLSSRAEDALLSHIPPMMAPEQDPEIPYTHCPMGKIPHVGIIGAGLAGLRCADILIQSGVRVTILEARNRIGGRVYQDSIGGHLVDFGPNWMHGTKNNPIVEICNESGTKKHEWDSRQSVFSSTGELHDEKTTNKISECLWTIIDEAFEYSRNHMSSIPAEKSLLDFIQEKIQATGLNQHEKEACVELSRLWGAYVGDSIQTQSLRFLFLEECIEGNNVFVASTYKDILKHVAAPAVSSGCIRLNEVVTNIRAQDRDSGSKSQNVTVKTTAGAEYEFDEVVVTCPLGWLKLNKSAFSPPMPTRLSEAMDNISYGRLEKVYVTFPTAFWHELPESKPTSNGDVINTVSKQQNGNRTQSTTTQRPPAFSLFHSPTYVDHPAGIPWNQECVSLADLPEDCAHPTLLFYLYGSCATHVVSELKPLDPASDAYYEKLNNLLKPYFSKLANYDEFSISCKPTAFLATQWQNDPWAGNGSYCNFQTGLEDGGNDISTMRAGMGVERGVWFAGEHTAPYVALGTTTGAYWSGELVAGKISQFYGMETKGGEAVGEIDVKPSNSSIMTNGTSDLKVKGEETKAVNGDGAVTIAASSMKLTSTQTTSGIAKGETAMVGNGTANVVTTKAVKSTNSSTFKPNISTNPQDKN